MKKFMKEKKRFNKNQLPRDFKFFFLGALFTVLVGSFTRKKNSSIGSNNGNVTYNMSPRGKGKRPASRARKGQKVL